MSARSDNIDRHVGQRLQGRRQALEIPEADLAQYVDVSVNELRQMEAGTRKITAGELFALAEKLSVEIRYFFEDL